MRKSERLTTLGTLAAEIAHEIRNPLMVVRLLFDSLKFEEQQEEGMEKDISIIREKLNHLDEIAGRILDFGKSREAFRKDFSVQGILDEAALLVRLKLDRSKVHLSMKSLSHDIRVFVDKGQIQQALLNLILNALGAMSGGGDLRIDGEELEEGKVSVYVSDTGTGIPLELRERIFDSFLTGTSEGTGLGLTISKRILRAHNGDLELVESGEGGTTFRLTLPVSFSDQTS